MNWGGFAGGFAQGFNNGVNMGRQVKTAMREAQLEEIRAKGIEEARAAREQDIAGQINDAGEAETKTQSGETVAKTAPVEMPKVEEKPLPDKTPAAQGIGSTPATNATPITPQTQTADQTANPFAGGISQQPSEPQAPLGRFVVGNQRYGTPEQARAAAEKNVGSAQDYILKNVVPKLQEKYIEFGDLESAQKLGDYMESRRGKEATNIFGKAMTAMLTGDTDTGVKHFGEYYNKFIDDGVDFKSHSIGKDGKINFTVTRKSDGKDFDMSLTRGELLRLGMAHDPAKMYASMLDAEKTATQQAGEIAKEDRAFKRDIYKDDRNHAQAKEMEGIKQSNAIEKMTIEKQLEEAKASSEVRAKVKMLRESGSMTDDEIKAAIPSLVIGSQFKKGASPEEAARLAHDALMKSDPMFSRKSEAEKQAAVEAVMRINQAAAAIGGKKPNAATAATEGLPQPVQKKGIPFFDTKTGKIEYR